MNSARVLPGFSAAVFLFEFKEGQLLIDIQVGSLRLPEVVARVGEMCELDSLAKGLTGQSRLRHGSLPSEIVGLKETVVS